MCVTLCALLWVRKSDVWPTHSVIHSAGIYWASCMLCTLRIQRWIKGIRELKVWVGRWLMMTSCYDSIHLWRCRNKTMPSYLGESERGTSPSLQGVRENYLQGVKASRISQHKQESSQAMGIPARKDNIKAPSWGTQWGAEGWWHCNSSLLLKVTCREESREIPGQPHTVV